ncbi:hypothetical protein K501DRAFT_255685 [Backusella circina FSU 941]|nr:hypothetical protein K501DRAFT_255685 [Backusella circina FSU 941]
MLYRLVAATRPLSRVAFARAQPILLRAPPVASFHSSRGVWASSQDWQQAPQHPLIEKIQQHPHIMQQLLDFTNLLQSKGVDVSGKQPSFMQVMKVMNDPEVKEKVKVLAQDMQAAGIQLDMAAIQELQSSFGSMAKPPPQTEYEAEKPEQVEEEQQHGRKRGVLNKMKGLFNKK